MKTGKILKDLVLDENIAVPAGTLVEIVDEAVCPVGIGETIIETRYHNMSYLVNSKDIEFAKSK